MRCHQRSRAHAAHRGSRRCSRRRPVQSALRSLRRRSARRRVSRRGWPRRGSRGSPRPWYTLRCGRRRRAPRRPMTCAFSVGHSPLLWPRRAPPPRTSLRARDRSARAHAAAAAVSAAAAAAGPRAVAVPPPPPPPPTPPEPPPTLPAPTAMRHPWAHHP
eukprot:scaffold55723_cov63-Phaeocystis_antarctica.AAC.3